MSRQDADAGPGLGLLGVLGVALGLIAFTVLVKGEFVLVLNDQVQTAPSGTSSMVTYRTTAEREHQDRVTATRYSAARFAVTLAVAERRIGATKRSVLRAARNGEISVPQTHVIETRLGWVHPVEGGWSLCVESDVTAAVSVHGDVSLIDGCAR